MIFTAEGPIYGNEFVKGFNLNTLDKMDRQKPVLYKRDMSLEKVPVTGFVDFSIIRIYDFRNSL